MAQHYHSHQLREAVLTHTQNWILRKHFVIKSNLMSLKIKVGVWNCHFWIFTKIFDTTRLVFEQFEFLKIWKLIKKFLFTTAYLLLVWLTTFTFLDTRGYLEVKNWWYKKTVLYVFGDINLIKIWEEENFFVRSHFGL